MIENYDVIVNDTRKVRGAVMYATDQGPVLLKEMTFSEKRVPVLYDLSKELEKHGYPRTDGIMKTKEDAFFCVSEDDTKYILKKWFYGRECDHQKESDIMEAVRNLALLHRTMEECENIPNYERESLDQEYFRHNRELRKVRAYIRDRSMKGDFELFFLKHFEDLYQWAEAAAEQIKTSGYKELLQKSMQEGKLVHGDYNYHNILITSAGVATTNFEHIYSGIPVTDLYDFLRKIMEKNQWNVSLGHKILEAYSRILPLSEQELEYIALCIAYPEKFWKIANSYYRSSKAWVSAKNLEKLEMAVLQVKQKQNFLNSIFSFSL